MDEETRHWLHLFKHHVCPECQKRWHWSQLEDGCCPDCGYDIIEGWTRQTYEGTREGLAE
jgi:predicted amidophosphoribosyltransferase